MKMKREWCIYPFPFSLKKFGLVIVNNYICKNKLIRNNTIMIYDRSQFDDSLLDNEVNPTENSVPPTEEPITEEDPNQEPEEGDDPIEEEDPDKDLDAFSAFLKSKGVRDGKTIIYEDEDTGEQKEVDFNSLDKAEQLEILNSLSDPGLTEDEIETINFLRKNNTSLQDVITFYQQKAIDDYIAKTISLLHTRLIAILMMIYI